MKASGISTGFPVLFQTSGQVPHVLLTRSPLELREQALEVPFDLHVLSAPPAFVLSQDQTLHRDLRLLAGPTDRRVATEVTTSNGDMCSPPTEVEFERNCLGQPTNRLPALAFAITLHVFKERPFERVR